MAGGVELGVGYLSIVPETSKVVPGINSALTSAQGGADKAGRGIGGKLASGIGSTLKFGAASAGAAAAGIIGTALTQGMKRVVAIDDAKGKLAGLGHTAEGVTTIMDSALASVKGTAFGLGDAAGIAASAVAAGIKPGQDLTKYLKLTGDAATIAGSSLSEMGSIFNKVQTSGSAYTDNLNQLADRGIPIFQWLQDEYKVSADGLKKMVKEGKIDAETFNKVIEKNIGGAALESGKTLRGSFANMKAALGRAGAAVIEPFLPMMKAGLRKVMEFTDKVTPHLKRGAEKVSSGLSDMGKAFMSSGDSIEGPANKMERFGVKARTVVDNIRGVWSILADGKFAGEKMTFGLSEDSKVVDVLFKIRETAIGVFDILFKGNYTSPIWGQLEDSKAVDVLFRIRESAKALWDVIRSPSGDKFTKFLETVKGSGGGAAGAMGSVRDGANGLTGALKKIGAAAAGGAAAIVSLGGDTATVAVTGIKALGNVMGFFADHTGLATVAIAGFAASVAIAKTVHVGYEAARIAQAVMMPAQMVIQRQMTLALIAHTAALRANIVAMGGALPVEQASLASRTRLAVATRLSTAATVSSTSSLAAYAVAQRAAAASSGMLIGGMRQATASAAMMGARVGAVGSSALGGLKAGLGSAVGFLGGPMTLGIMAAAGAAMYMGSKFSESADKVADSERTYREYGETVKKTNTDLRDALDQSNGVVDKNVSNVMTQKIDDLRASSQKLADDAPGFWGSFGASAADAWDRLDGQLDGTTYKSMMTADALSFDGGRIISAMNKTGLSSSELGAIVSGSQADFNKFSSGMQQAGGDSLFLNLKMQDMRAEFLHSRTAAGQVEAAIQQIGDKSVGAAAGIDLMKNSYGQFISDSRTTEEAQKSVTMAIDGVTQALANGGAAAIDANGKLDLTTKAGVQVDEAMKRMGASWAEAGSAARTAATEQKLSAEEVEAAQRAAEQGVRDQFIQTAAQITGNTDKARALADVFFRWPPEVKTNIVVLDAEARGKVEQFLKDNTSRTIDVLVKTTMLGQTPAGLPPTVVPGGWEGLMPYANGGISNLPEQATIQPGRGAGLVQWAEGETGGEAYIPLAPSKRDRSTAILAEVAERFGMRLESFADGGVRAALDAARSVTGNAYQLGGTGPSGFDCSGFIGWLQQILMGVPPDLAAGNRLYTTYSLLGGALEGLAPGSGPAGTVFVVGASEPHMAATLAGQPVEAGGAHGTSRIGAPAVGANDSQFPSRFHLPNELIAGGVGGAAGVAATGREVEWTEKDQLDLESARVAVQQAKEARDKTYSSEKKSDADRQQADLRVQRAELKVRTMEQKRDGTGISAMPDEPAPPLTGEMGEDAITMRNAEISLLDAQLARDKTYNDPESTSLDKEKADLQVYSAQNSLAETKKRIAEDADKSGTDGFSVKDRLKKFGSDMAGIAVDSFLEIIGFENRFLDISLPEFKAPGVGSTVGPGTPLDILKSVLPSDLSSRVFPQSEIDGQLPVTPGAPGWVEGWMKALPVGLDLKQAAGGPLDMLLKAQGGKIPLHDDGGWLMPGLTMNLTKKPEPVLNPAQHVNLERIANLDTKALMPARDRAAEPWSPGVQITNQITVSNDRSQVRKFREENAMLLMQYGGAK